jgi:hypothetical protein
VDFEIGDCIVGNNMIFVAWIFMDFCVFNNTIPYFPIFSELNKDVSSFRQQNLEAKPTSSLSILNSYPNIKTLFKKFNTVIA